MHIIGRAPEEREGHHEGDEGGGAHVGRAESGPPLRPGSSCALCAPVVPVPTLAPVSVTLIVRS